MDLVIKLQRKPLEKIATVQSKPNLRGQKGPCLCLSQPKSVTQLRIVQTVFDERENQESLRFVNLYSLTKTPVFEKAQFSMHFGIFLAGDKSPKNLISNMFFR